MITKLIIQGYREGQSLGDEFTTLINPEKITLKRALRFNEGENANTKSDINQFSGYGQDTLSFDLILDGTGIANEKIDVAEKIHELQNVIYLYKGDEHKPYYLMVVYGEFGFKCHLKDMTIEYNLFKTDGTPLRAKISLSFIGYNMAGQIELEANKQSPDMTHIKTIRYGDRLPLLCKEIYDNPKHYLQIAKLNGITNFRKLDIGTRLMFPPIEK